MLKGLLQHNSFDRMIFDEAVRKIVLFEKDEPFADECLIQPFKKLEIYVRKSVGKLMILIHTSIW